MPYTPAHKQQTRARIVRSARQLFNQRGFNEVSIDEIMATAGLTRGGFYNHFRTKNELYVEVLAAFVAERREGGGGPCARPGPEMARLLFEQYVSRAHLDAVEEQCPLMALPSDVARAGPAVRAAYQGVLEALVGMFERALAQGNGEAREQALALAATCVGAMVLARTVEDRDLAESICQAARALAADTIGGANPGTTPNPDPGASGEAVGL